MKKRRLILFVALFLFLSMGLAACGGSGASEDVEPEAAPVEEAESEVDEAAVVAVEEEDSEPEVQEAEEPEAESETAEEVAEEAPAEPEEAKGEEQAEAVEEEMEEEAAEEASSSIAELLQLSDVNTSEGLDNYTMDLSMTFTSQDENGDDVTQTILADIIFSNDPSALSMNMTLEGVEGAEEFGNMSMVQTEGSSYVVVPGLGCITTEIEELNDNPFADLADSDQILEGINEAKFEGEETINGIDTLHYTFDASNLTEEEAADVEWVEGHIYLAKDGGYMVRFVMEGEGVMDQFSDSNDQFGTMQMEYNITPSDETLTVEIPAECAGAGADDSPYPILDDAEDYNYFGGFITYLSEAPLEDVIAFYEEALTADGWVKDEEAGMYLEGSMASYEYSKDDLSISLMILLDESTGNTSVTIIEGE